MNNWKTTVSGAVAAIGAALQGSDNPTLHIAGVCLTTMGALLLGYHSSDK